MSRCVYTTVVASIVVRWTDPKDIGFIRRFLDSKAASDYSPATVYRAEEVRTHATTVEVFFFFLGRYLLKELYRCVLR